MRFSGPASSVVKNSHAESNKKPLNETNKDSIFEGIALIGSDNYESYASLETSMKQVLEKVGHLKAHQDKMMNILLDIKYSVHKKHIKTDTSIVTQMLPLGSIEKILEFDLFLDEGENSRIFEQFILQIGGSSAKNHTHRAFKRVFTNEVAVSCSWLGYRKNFKISNTKPVVIIKDLIISKYDMEQKEFEDIGADWFRFAKQRYLREKKDELLLQPEKNLL